MPRGGPARRRRGGFRTGIAAALLSVGAALFPAARPAAAGGLLAQIETEVQKLAADLSRSVVTVRAVRVSPGQGEITEVYIGTGVVFDSGWVMSTPSVVAQGVRYSVQAPGDVPVPAELIGFDADAQTAVFRTPSLRLRPARVQTDSILVPGQMLLVVGNAYGLETAVSWGIAAGVRDDGFWQIGVNVAPGGSGSPVANARGEIVGLVVAALSGAETPNAAGFAGHVAVIVPTYRAYPVARRMIREGAPGRAYLGIRPETVEPDLSRAIGLSRGVLVGAVSFGSPAYAAGLRAGDVIVELDHRPMEHESDLRRVLAEHCPGEEVDIALVRMQELHSVRVRLGQLPEVFPQKPQGPPALTLQSVNAGVSPARDSNWLAEQIRLLERRVEALRQELDSRR